MKDVADELFAVLRMARVRPMPVVEHRFHETRRWRFDLAWPDMRFAVEVEGGQYVGGHVTKGRFEGDMEKYNEAALAGWMVLRVSPRMVRDGRALAVVERALRARF